MGTSDATSFGQLLDAVLTVKSFIKSIVEDWLQLCGGGKEGLFRF